MTTNYDGDDRTGTCGGTKADGEPCSRQVTFSIEEPYGDPILDSIPYCEQHRDQEPESKPPKGDWKRQKGF